MNEETLNHIFDKNVIGLSEDTNGEFYTVYNRKSIIQEILKLWN